MTVDQNTAARPPKPPVVRRAALPGSEGRPQLESPMLPSALQRLNGEAARFAAVAPGSLDLMGGLSDFSGALVLAVPTDEHVCAVAQCREDGNLRVLTQANEDAPFQAPVDSMIPVSDDAGRARAISAVRAEPGHEVRAVVAALAESVAGGVLPAFPRGLSVSVAAEPSTRLDGRGVYALCAAVVAAAAGALDGAIDPAGAVAACDHAVGLWLGLPPAPANSLLAFSGTAGAINRLRMDTGVNGGPVSLPAGITIVGVDCGFVRDDLVERNAGMRATSFMGRRLIDCIVRHDGYTHLQWDGHLSRVSVNDYTERFRDRLPRKLTGREFLDRFGETGDRFSRIDPDQLYKIRSRTEHHIYEHARSCQLAECIARAARGGSLDPLCAAREPFRASHWSYGQRCGLGSVESDRLVELIREHGDGTGIYGVRLCGRGCGGVVAVLMRNDAAAETALARALDQYADQIGCSPRLLTGSRPGCLIGGPWAV